MYYTVDFFKLFLRDISGNILMLSEGKHGIDNVYSLKDGKLDVTYTFCLKFKY